MVINLTQDLLSLCLWVILPHKMGIGYIIYPLNHFFVSRDVIFREDKYPFSHIQIEILDPSFIDSSDMFVYDDHHSSMVLPEVSIISPSLSISPNSDISSST